MQTIEFGKQEGGTMYRVRSALLTGLGIVALAAPAGAAAMHGESHGKAKAKGHAQNGKPGGPQGHAVDDGSAEAKGHGKGKGQAKRGQVGYLFKGFYAGEGMVEVKRGNAHVRKAGLIGETVEFDFSAAHHVVVTDTNADGMRSLDDVMVGDWVLVKSRLPRKDPGDQPFEARWLIDKTNHSLDEGPEPEPAPEV